MELLFSVPGRGAESQDSRNYKPSSLKLDLPSLLSGALSNKWGMKEIAYLLELETLQDKEQRKDPKHSRAQSSRLSARCPSITNTSFSQQPLCVGNWGTGLREQYWLELKTVTC